MTSDVNREEAPGGPSRSVGPRLTPGLSRSQLAKAPGGKVSVEGQRVSYPQLSHEHEAGRIHEGVLALVVAAQPPNRIGLPFGFHADHIEPGRRLEEVEEPDCDPVPRSAPEKGPRFPADLVAGDEPPCVVLPEEKLSLPVVGVPRNQPCDPERGIDEDQRG